MPRNTAPRIGGCQPNWLPLNTCATPESKPVLCSMLVLYDKFSINKFSMNKSSISMTNSTQECTVTAGTSMTGRPCS